MIIKFYRNSFYKMSKRLCKAENCGTRASFGEKNGVSSFCKKHKSPTMINLISDLCKAENCGKIAIFGIEKSKGIYCKKHKTIEMEDVKTKRCEQEGCKSLNPTFALLGQSGKFCKHHKTIEMIDVKNKKCEKCDAQPNFGFIGEQPRFCKLHKLEKMTDVKNNKCEKCDAQPNFGLPGGKERFCKKHKTPEMVDVKNNTCKFTGCPHQPNFGLPGEKARFCKTHKTDEMIDIKSSFCEDIDCNITASFDFPEGKGRFCKLHKLEGMENIRSKRCEEEGCKVLSPCFDFKDGKGRFCGKHKLDGMKNVKRINCYCGTSAFYGLPGKTKSKCARHREKGMIRNSNGTCKISKCKNMATFGLNYIPKHCEEHKEENEQNLVEFPCISCNLPMILDENKQCEYCNPKSFKRVYLSKQNALMDYLNYRGLEGTHTDIIVNGTECGFQRPDRVFDLEDKVIIVECDEYQHRGITCECETTRMINIGQGYGGLPVYFIRWNPDNYKTFGDAIPESLSKRYNLLGDYLEEIIENKIELPKALISTFYMYFDSWNGLSNEKWNVIMNYEF